MPSTPKNGEVGSVTADDLGVDSPQELAQDVTVVFRNDAPPEEVFAAKRAAEKEATKPVDRKYVLAETRIDKFNSQSGRVLLTPAVCSFCGADLLERRGVNKSYFALSKLAQEEAREAVSEHVRGVHTAAELRIVSEADLPKGE